MVLPLALAPRVFLPQASWPLAKASCGVEAAAGEDDFSVKAGLCILDSVELDDAAHFAAVVGGNAGGIDGHRLDVVGFEFGTEAGGAIVGEGDAIDDELSLVLGATGMEDGVALVEPAGLGVDEVLQGAAGNGAEPMLDGIRANLIDGAGLVGIDEGTRRVDGDGLGDGRQFELESLKHRER